MAMSIPSSPEPERASENTTSGDQECKCMVCRIYRCENVIMTVFTTFVLVFVFMIRFLAHVS